MTSSRLPAPLDLTAPGWLPRLLPLYLELHDPADAAAALAEVRARYPEAGREALATRLALRRLTPLGLKPQALLLPPRLQERLVDLGVAGPDMAAAGLLSVQWDVLMDIAHLHGRDGPSEARQLELLTVMALEQGDLPLARKLDQALREGRPLPLERVARQVERRLAPRGLPALQASLSIGIGLAYVQARTLASLAALYFERAEIEEEMVEHLQRLSREEKVQLVEVLLAVAWADGRVVGQERALIEQQIQHARLDKDTTRRLRALLDAPPEPEALTLRPADASTRRFVLEQAALLSLVDDEQSDQELTVVEEIARRLGGTPDELAEVLVEVAAFYARHRDAIQELGPASGPLARLHRLVLDRAQAAVRKNLRALTTEIKETGELARLLGAASVRPLTREEGQKVKAQLLDICKSIPALAIFALPGGGVLLPVLLKLLPFNILPSAFSEAEAPAGAEPASEEPPESAAPMEPSA